MGNATQCYSGFKDHLQEHRGQASTRGSGKATACLTPCLPHLLFPSFLSKRSSLCDKKKQSMSPQKKLVSAWIRLHSLAGTLGVVLHAARENEGPMPACTPLLSQETFGQWKAESRQLTAPVWGLLCAAPFTLSSCFAGNSAFHLT